MKTILNKIGLMMLPLLINMLIGTLRIKIHNLPDNKSNYIFIFWHSQMLIGWWLFKDKNSGALVSKSSDGDILDNLLTKWNYRVFRGSSSKGGKEALQELMSYVDMNNPAVITPDGPRGPRGEMKNGAFIISNKCSVPVIPVRIVYHKKKVLTKSWDKFEIPYPFSKCEVYFGNEYQYVKYLDEAALNELKNSISREM